MSDPSRIVVSCGDLNGIGLECFVGAVQGMDVSDLVLVGPVDGIRTCCTIMSLPAYVDDGRLHVDGRMIDILNVAAPVTIAPGSIAADTGRAALLALETSIHECIAGRAAAMVTLPISKEACTQAGWTFPGQTEMLAARTGGTPLMILCTRDVRVALATIHEPLATVGALITHDNVRIRIEALHRSLTIDWGIARPKIAVLGLNPHAGEHGMFGREELDVIAPVIASVRQQGIDTEGPFPADGFFAFGAYASYDGILAMYHDQGLIPLKLLAHGGGVNMTAGLPIVRTSPDHGTGFSLAGKGMADPLSTKEAIQFARDIVRNRTLSRA